MQPTRQSTKQTQILMVFAFAMLPILLLVFLSSPDDKQVPIPIYGAAIAMLVGGIYASLTMMRLDREPAEFQTGMLVTMALFELVALFGIFLSNVHNMAALAPFAAASTLADLVIVLPKVLAYWRNRA